jgi:hypothetical protein
MASTAKAALEELLKARRLQADVPPLRGEDCRLTPLATGVAEVDGLLGGGFPRGRLSELYGPVSAGRTGLALALVARVTHGGALAAWVDPRDRLDPASAAAAGVVLPRLLWLRGERRHPLEASVSALATLLGSGLFAVAALDLAGVAAADVRRLPGATWIRLQRLIEDAPTALVLLADAHTACGPGGASLALAPQGARWSGSAGPGRLFRGLDAEARAGRHAFRSACFELHASH